MGQLYAEDLSNNNKATTMLDGFADALRPIRSRHFFQEALSDFEKLEERIVQRLGREPQV